MKNKVEHPPHWHVVRADGITYAQGQCDGYPAESGESVEPETHYTVRPDGWVRW